jgi:putative ABC transport system substrate-binding protein
MIDCRAFITLLGRATLLGVTRPAIAQKAKSVTIAYLALLPGEDRMSFMREFVKRLGELGYVDGQNLKLVYRSAEGRPDLLPGSRRSWSR